MPNLTKEQKNEMREKIVLAKFPNLCKGTTNTKLNMKKCKYSLADVLRGLDVIDGKIKIERQRSKNLFWLRLEIINSDIWWNIDHDLFGQSEETQRAINNLLTK